MFDWLFGKKTPKRPKYITVAEYFRDGWQSHIDNKVIKLGYWYKFGERWIDVFRIYDMSPTDFHVASTWGTFRYAESQDRLLVEWDGDEHKAQTVEEFFDTPFFREMRRREEARSPLEKWLKPPSLDA